MSHSLIQVLTWIFLAVLWIFFIRAIRIVWVEVKQQRKALEDAADRLAKASGSRLAPLKFRIIDPEDLAGTSFELVDNATIGRSNTCTIPIGFDDFSSAVHARIFVKDDKLLIEDLQSTNGTFVNEKEVVRPTSIERGDIVQVGNTIFEVYR
jgi:pSer/pThr/pTyr-binding forkhead associated (FHA) protein